MKNRFLVLILFAATLLHCRAATDGDEAYSRYWVVVSLRDGTIEGYPFVDRPTITIKDDLFTLTTVHRTVGYPAKSVDRFRLTDSYEVPRDKGDVNIDGAVDVADIATVISIMADENAGESIAKIADVNGDGTVDVADIASIITIMASGN